MLVNRRYDKLAVLVIVVGLLVYATIQPSFRLRPTMPSDFPDDSKSWTPQKRFAEEQIAEAYWNLAVSQVQWKYGYAQRLPDEPPPEFVITRSGLAPLANDPGTRIRYWRRLQQMWYLPTTWQKQYGWSLRPMLDYIQRIGQWLDSSTGEVLKKL
jgi:hypothetical protein